MPAAGIGWHQIQPGIATVEVPAVPLCILQHFSIEARKELKCCSDLVREGRFLEF